MAFGEIRDVWPPPRWSQDVAARVLAVVRYFGFRVRVCRLVAGVAWPRWPCGLVTVGTGPRTSRIAVSGRGTPPTGTPDCASNQAATPCASAQTQRSSRMRRAADGKRGGQSGLRTPQRHFALEDPRAQGPRHQRHSWTQPPSPAFRSPASPGARRQGAPRARDDQKRLVDQAQSRGSHPHVLTRVRPLRAVTLRSAAPVGSGVHTLTVLKSQAVSDTARCGWGSC